MSEFKVFVGVDWATQNHQVCAVDQKGKVIRERGFEHSGVGLAQMAAWIAELSEGSAAEVAVGIEVPRGPVVETLLDRGFAVHSLNPLQMDRFRDRQSPSGAKDDRRDARVIADSLRTDLKAFRRVVADEPAIIELRAWSRIAEELTCEQQRLANQMREELWRYYPQMLKLTDEITAEWFLRLWEFVKTPELAKRANVNRISRLLRAHRVRRASAQEMLDVLREKPVVLVAGAIEAAVAHVELLVGRLLLVGQQHKQAQKRLDALCAALAQPPADGDPPGQKREHRDAAILQSLPGVGRIVLATMLAEATEPLSRRDYHALRTLSGVAPITKRSGRSASVSMRYACSQRLRNALFYWAKTAISIDPASRARYAGLRARGHKHARALRTVGDGLLAVACAMLTNGTTYDPSRRRPTQTTDGGPGERPAGAPARKRSRPPKEAAAPSRRTTPSSS
jgi:transposase